MSNKMATTFHAHATGTQLALHLTPLRPPAQLAHVVVQHRQHLHLQHHLHQLPPPRQSCCLPLPSRRRKTLGETLGETRCCSKMKEAALDKFDPNAQIRADIFSRKIHSGTFPTHCGCRLALGNRDAIPAIWKRGQCSIRQGARVLPAVLQGPFQ